MSWYIKQATLTLGSPEQIQLTFYSLAITLRTIRFNIK